MANPHRGEVTAVLDGRAWTLCLTLGALAELETAFRVSDMTALVARFSNGELSARDAVKIIGAGLRGAGNPVDDDQVARMTAEGGAVGFAAIVSALLTATFGGTEREGGDPS
ncbi:gene transfer agent family protein [Acuticoccus sp. 2012]|uniref:Gene transfer agent family protein n=2 Tax=Acuticoccus mangrovi TaxID=2796142 RepID=A0A934IM06_9HYPH|nr:gene transfer agent family protein [Acuticoccus mangrovi]